MCFSFCDKGIFLTTLHNKTNIIKPQVKKLLKIHNIKFSILREIFFFSIKDIVLKYIFFFFHLKQNSRMLAQTNIVLQNTLIV